MASIVKRKKKYSVVYTYTDENGNKRQKWETFETNAEAKKRKLQVEYEQESGTFIPPSAKTVNDLLDGYHVYSYHGRIKILLFLQSQKYPADI